jgi:hypothetical protein
VDAEPVGRRDELQRTRARARARAFARADACAFTGTDTGPHAGARTNARTGTEPGADPRAVAGTLVHRNGCMERQHTLLRRRPRHAPGPPLPGHAGIERHLEREQPAGVDAEPVVGARELLNRLRSCGRIHRAQDGSYRGAGEGAARSPCRAPGQGAQRTHAPRDGPARRASQRTAVVIQVPRRRLAWVRGMRSQLLRP